MSENAPLIIVTVSNPAAFSGKGSLIMLEYPTGRSRDWVKDMRPARDADHRGRRTERQRLGRLGRQEADGSIYASTVDHGFDKGID